MNFFFEMLFLIELKNRIILVFFCWAFSFLVLYINKDNLFFDISKSSASGETIDEVSYFIFTTPSEVVSIHLHTISFFSGCFAFTSILHHTLSFLAPSLQVADLKKLVPFSGVGLKFIVLLAPGIFKVFVAPLIVQVLLEFSAGYNSESPNPLLYEASVSQYVAFYFFALNTFLGASLTFAVLFVSGSYSKTYNIMVKRRRSLYYGVVCVFSSVTVAYDLFSQLVCLVIFSFLFEHSALIWSVREAANRRQ